GRCDRDGFRDGSNPTERICGERKAILDVSQPAGFVPKNLPAARDQRNCPRHFILLDRLTNKAESSFERIIGSSAGSSGCQDQQRQGQREAEPTCQKRVRGFIASFILL